MYLADLHDGKLIGEAWEGFGYCEQIDDRNADAILELRTANEGRRGFLKSFRPDEVIDVLRARK